MGKHLAPPKNKHLKETKTEKKSLPGVNVKELIKNFWTKDEAEQKETILHRHRRERGFTAQEVLLVGASSLLFFVVWLLPTSGWLRIVTYAIAALFAGFPVILDAAESVINGELFESDVLMSFGAIVAFCIGEYPTAVFIMIIYRMCLVIEAYAISEKQRYLDSIRSVLPDSARLETAEGAEITEPEHVNVGDIVIVAPGEVIPLDGIVSAGTSAIDTSPLTAEKTSRAVAEGSVAVSGCINLTNPIKIQVMRTFEESTVCRALDMISSGGDKRAETEKLAFRTAHVLTPIVLVLALLTAILPPVLNGGGWIEWIGRGVLFICLSGSISLTASVPLAFLGGLGSAARYGVFADGAACLEKLAKTETFVFEKTGAITEGKFKVIDVMPVNMSEKELLTIAATAESKSNHPIAHALRLACEAAIPEEDDVMEIEDIPGRGVSAFIGDRHVYVGNAMLLLEHDITFMTPNKNGTIIYVAVDNEYAGHIILNDKVKDGAFDAIEGLRANGVLNTVMLTGDVRAVARPIASALNFDMVKPELNPNAKVAAVEYLMATKGSGTSLAFVCSGTSDLPALERADVGIAVGALRTGNALNTADVSLMGEDIRKIPLLLRIARSVKRVSMNAILTVLAVKAALMLLGALGAISIWLAMLCDMLVLCYVIYISLRTFRI